MSERIGEGLSYAGFWLGMWLAIGAGCVADGYKSATLKSACIEKTGNAQCAALSDGGTGNE